MEQAKVLIVDDLKQNLLALESVLSDLEGIQVLSAQSGDKALELALISEFAVALVDVQMPDMNGFELAKLLKGAKKHKDLPVIFVTALSHSEENIAKGYEVGAVDFLFKPINSKILRSKVQILVDLYRKNQRLDELKIKAQEGSESKNRFLAHMSHEMRTPLSAIQGFAEMLEIDSPAEVIQQSAEVIKRNSKYLVEIIDDILDFAKIEANKIDITSSSFAPRDLINDIKLSLQGRAEEKGIIVETHFEGKIPDLVIAGETRIRQALINVLSNAIKYTEEGRVDISVSFMQKPEATLQITVKDTGVGIPFDEQGRVFEPFYRAKATKSLEGSGLGLSLTRKLIKAMGGDIAFRSKKGTGTEFDLFFKVKLPPGATLIDSSELEEDRPPGKEKSEEPLKVKNCTVLVVDDNRDLRIYAKETLSSRGFSVLLASDGAQALNIVKERGDDTSRKIDVVLMDLQMPIMDGYDAMEEMRKDGFKKPIIAFSAHVMEQDKQKCFDSGCTDFMSKPIAREQLVKKILAYCPGRTKI